jgi:hypothetical protein
MTVDDDDRPYWTWALAGFADGSMGIFDERVAGNILLFLIPSFLHSFLHSCIPSFLSPTSHSAQS